ncbi:MAG: ribosome maturation factor RimP [Candidatus Rokubacteria bacterium]|nr:ribosome maturation factor RimP [Candidatus Rokubacteria bacterium]MBI3827208.1 ribosome maturation factor RimP [Candidatus Rokubacteria bacterium]
MQDDERVTRIEEAVEPVVRGHGLELVDLDWRPRGPRAVLRVYVDKPGGVAIADCERVSRELGDVLDVAGLIPDAYDLEVSSPGLDRQLRTEREYRWATGKRVRCWLHGGRDVQGRLVEVGGDRFVIERDGERVDVSRGDVGKIRLEAEVPWQKRSL